MTHCQALVQMPTEKLITMMMPLTIKWPTGRVTTWLQTNSNDGQITLQQMMPDNVPVQAEVLNATGMSVYKGQIQFEGGVTSLDIQQSTRVVPAANK